MSNAPLLTLSHSLDILVDRLADRLSQDAVFPFSNRVVLVPNLFFKHWLNLEIARRNGISMGLRLLTIPQWISESNPTHFRLPNSLEMFFLIYSALLKSEDPALRSYLEAQNSRLSELSTQLASLFFKYGQLSKTLFNSLRKPSDWQLGILQKIFTEGDCRTPIQIASEITPAEIHCFGIDYLAPPFWEMLFRSTALSIYLFSPCADFWTDVCSHWERRKLTQSLKIRGVSNAIQQELEGYLREAPPLLANWGKLGRETLKTLDRFIIQTEEDYSPPEETSLLKRIQSDFLYFHTPEESQKLSGIDSSIQISLTGSSRLREIEILRDAIARLVSATEISYSEITVLAPNIQSYAPFIQFVFTDPEASIPHRIFGFDDALANPFSQGLHRLTALAFNRWDLTDVLSLFENRAFARKQNWDSEKQQRLKKWVESVHVEWGIDGAHRQDALQKTLGVEVPFEDSGSWERGIDRLLDAIIYLFPGRDSLQISPDSFEEFAALFTELKNDLLPFRDSKESLSSWASRLETLANKYLSADSSDEAAHSLFCRFLDDLRRAELCIGPSLFPFSEVRSFLLKSSPGQLNASHLHAVQFASFDECAMIPAKAIFLIGMDEESFPRPNLATSLDLLSHEKFPTHSDRDRYLFLQVLFSAKEFLSISYGHLSPDEGKPVGPSLLVQELLSYLDTAFSLEGSKVSAALTTVHPPQTFDEPQRQFPFFAACPKPSLPEGELTLSISDLVSLARHPWKFYLQKALSIYLNEPWNPPFAVQKSQLLRASLSQSLEAVWDASKEEVVPGTLGEAFRSDLVEKSSTLQQRLADWGIENVFTIAFRQSSKSQKWESANRLEMPPLEIPLSDRLTIRLVGEIKNCTSKGWLCFGDDSFGGLLKAWPEALIASIALNASEILLLKSGKSKPLEEPAASLSSFLTYYFQCLAAPSPLLPDWADAFLRKGTAELEKKIQSTLSGRGFFEDAVAEWILARTESPSAQVLSEEWGGCLKEVFKELIALYPTRARKGKSNAAV